MDRMRCRNRAWMLPASLLLCAALPGCASTLATAYWVIHGTDTPAEFDGLKEKRVVVVCRPVASLQYRYSTVARELASQVQRRLQENVKKIDVVEQQVVDDWQDNNNWEEFTEIGKALKADMVVAIELEHFNLYQGQTLYQGQANAHLKVYDMQNGGKLVWEKSPKQTLFPPSGGIPTSERQEAQFRREYLTVLSDELARHFFAYDSMASFAIDSTALK
jgi:ABC-type uncharacterized transport system auxiliary subunit